MYCWACVITIAVDCSYGQLLRIEYWILKKVSLKGFPKPKKLTIIDYNRPFIHVKLFLIYSYDKTVNGWVM